MKPGCLQMVQVLLTSPRSTSAPGKIANFDLGDYRGESWGDGDIAVLAVGSPVFQLGPQRH
jgi:hypothetical protein